MYRHPRHLFGPLQRVRQGDQIKPPYAVALDCYRRAHGLPPWLKRDQNAGLYPTAAEVNSAVDWFNEWLEHGGN